NIGVQDAFNLGWKLARVVNGTARDALLETYHAERHPVGARVLRMTMASVALRRPDDRTNALRETVAELLRGDEARKRYAAMLSGLDLAYALGEGHPLLGRRMPDLDLATANGKTRVYSLLQDAQPLLLDFARITRAQDGIKRVECKSEGAWALPVIGTVAAPSAVLLRPDGHVAWVGMENDAGLREAIARHLGGDG
ncbi:MAG: hypothetical protein HOQ01_09210, partial [Lysobacter sp.]|nr:hypothetical protein [Lysobacter sp.]